MRKAAAIATAGALISGMLWAGKDKLHLLPVPAYEAARVIDGDSFETKEGQYIRVASTESPELKLCGGNEAKAALEKLILGKTLYLKVVYRDPYQRLVSFVYAGQEFINQTMLENGYSYYYRSSPGTIGEALKAATERAREQKKGIFSETCTQTNNPEKPKCNIKGNTRTGKIYYLPDCGLYPNVDLQLYLGDEWFCTEAAAIKAGFRKPEQCP